MNWNAKSVKDGNGTVVAENVTAVVERGTLTMIGRATRDVAPTRIEKTGVTSVEVIKGAPNVRLVTFDDGAQYTVTRKSGCGCGK